MLNLTDPPDNPADPLPPPGTTPYFRRLHAAVEETATWYDGGLTPEPWPA
jgi:hypothetical protein